MNLQIRLAFEDIFPDEEKQNLSYYLQGMSQKKLIRILVQILNASHVNSTWQKWDIFLFQKWFSASNYTFANMVYSKILKLESVYNKNSNKQRYALLTKITTLILAEHILIISSQSDHDDISIELIEVNLFKALLVINSNLNSADERATNNKNFAGYVSFPVGVAITFGLAQDELINTNHLKLLSALTTQLIKALYLFDFLQDKKPNLLRAFLDKYDCIDFTHYIKAFAPIVIHSLTNMITKYAQFEPNPLIITFEENDIDLESRSFIEKFVNSSNLIDEDIDFKCLRSSPVIRYDKNEYTIINELFAIQKIYNGMYFELKDLNEYKIQNKETNFRQYFTFNFTEKILLYKTMQNIYEKRSYVRYTGQDIEDTYKFKGGPDYYIRNGNNIFLIENKDILIAADVKTSYDFNLIKKELDKKLIDNKGLPQILNNIENAILKKFPFDINYKADKVSIFPILITHRSEFEVPGLNLYLKQIFTVLLDRIREKGHNIDGVRELTLINIDTLLLFQNAFRSRKLFLNDTIDAYHLAVNKEITNAKSKDDYDEKHSRTLYSYDDFMTQYVQTQKVYPKYEIEFWLRKYFKQKIFEDL